MTPHTEPDRFATLDGIDLWLLRKPVEAREMSAWIDVLSSDERAHLERLRIEDVRRAFVSSRGCLRRILGGYLDVAPGDVVLRREKRGKPVLDACHGPGRPHFSVSHSGDLFLYAVGRDRLLGVDVEQVRPDLDFEPLVRRFFAAGEAKQLLEDVDPGDRLDAFFRCWTRKEAFVKATGSGMARNLETFEVTVRPEDAPALVRLDDEGEEPGSWIVRDVDTLPGYAASLVSRPVD